MRILCLQHDPLDGPGALLDWAKERGFSVSLLLVSEVTTLPHTDTFDLLVSLGGPMGAYEEEKHPWLATEKEYLRRAFSAGKKILGLCLGCQLLADSLGGRAFRHSCKEFGWQSIHPTAGGSEWFGSSGTFQAFQWHGDTYSLPADAIRLAGNDAAEQQAFLMETRSGGRVLGLQFHLEWTEQMAREAMAEPGVAPPKSAFVQTPEEVLSDLSLFTRARERFFALLDRLIS